MPPRSVALEEVAARRCKSHRPGLDNATVQRAIHDQRGILKISVGGIWPCPNGLSLHDTLFGKLSVLS